jgi:hypothetical protein
MHLIRRMQRGREVNDGCLGETAEGLHRRDGTLIVATRA